MEERKEERYATRCAIARSREIFVTNPSAFSTVVPENFSKKCPSLRKGYCNVHDDDDAACTVAYGIWLDDDMNGQSWIFLGPVATKNNVCEECRNKEFFFNDDNEDCSFGLTWRWVMCWRVPQ